MRKSLSFLVVLMALALAVPAFGADHPQKPGKWQIKMEMSMAGMEFKMPPVTVEVCITPEDLMDPQKAIPNDVKSDCKVSDYKLDGKTVSWSVSCPKQKMTGDGTITYSDDTYSGTMNMKMGEQQMSTKYSGKWLGECTKK